MRIILIILSLIVVGPSLARADEVVADPVVADVAAVETTDVGSRWGFSAGLGYAIAWSREVNPDFSEAHFAPQIFAGVRFSHYSLLLEYTLDPTRDSKTGALAIQTRSTTFGAWGRYAFNLPPGWQPFVSLGAGAHFDEVETSFGGRVDERGGTRRFVGLGGGVSKHLFKYILSEIEARVTSDEASRRYGFGLNFRLGVTF